MNKNFKALSLFASAGIAEFGFENTNIDVVLASELLPIRMKMHSHFHKNVKTICGDITNDNIKKEIIEKSQNEKVDFIFATPPCQGMSLIGKNKSNDQMIEDRRNYLIFDVFEIIDALDPKCILIENIQRFFKMEFVINGKLFSIENIVRERYGDKYTIDCSVFNASKHGVPQSRKRAFIRMWKKDFEWKKPEEQQIITMKEAIGDLPALESGEKSSIKNHNSRQHIAKHIECLKHTPTGHSAFENEVYYPKDDKTGTRLKGYASTYMRMNWDKPAPTITMRNDCIASQSNCHPGRLLDDGTYSDARVLSIRELLILSSLNPDLDLPMFASDIQIRHMIGEAVPPKLINAIVKGLKVLNE